MGEGLKRAVAATRRSREISSDEFIKQWWAQRFPAAKQPTWDSAITCADASDLLNKFREFLKKVER